MLIPATVAGFFQNEPRCFNAVARVYGACEVGINKFAVRSYGFKQALKLGVDKVFLEFHDALINLCGKLWVVNGLS